MRHDKHKEVKGKSKNRLTLLVAVCVVVVVGGCFGIYNLINDDEAGAQNKAPAFGKKTELSIVCSGDNMAHQPQLDAAYDSESKSYNFDSSYKYIKDYVEDADLALANMEVTFPGSSYCGYPNFRTPDSFATAVKNAGFDVAITSNNHMADTGADGLKRSVKVLEKAGMDVVGSGATAEENSYIIKEVKGVKIGIVAYTFANFKSEEKMLINGNPLYGEDVKLARGFYEGTLKKDLEEIKGQVDAATEAGAQVVVVYYHFGEEYETEPNELQKKIAKATAKMDVDMIFASHPHVLQKTDIIKVKDDEGNVTKEVPIYYSLGNFISNQNRVTLNNKLTEIGALGRFDFVYDSKEDKVTDIKMNPVPTWVNKYYDGRTRYYIVPLADDFVNNDSVIAAGGVSKAKEAREIAYDILGIDKE